MEVVGVGMNRLLKTLLYLGVIFFTLYLGSFIVQYGLMMLMCVILIALGSLGYVHCEGHAWRDRLWSMTRKERQLHHAKKLPVFSVIPMAQPEEDHRQIDESDVRDRKCHCHRNRKAAAAYVSSLERVEVAEAGRVYGGAIVAAHCFRQIVCAPSGRLYRAQRMAHRRRSGTLRQYNCFERAWFVGWLGGPINPVLNAFLNRYVKCWNRSLMYCGIRLAAYGLNTTCVSLDFPTADVATLNFGQKDDCLVFDFIYDKVRRSYPKAKIILLSVCLGGLRVLNWLSRNPNPENVIGVILESPLPSVKHLLKGFLGSWYSQDLYNTFCMVVPNFRPELEEQYSFLREMKRCDDGKVLPSEVCRVPVFIGMIETDPFSNKSHLPLFCGRFPNLTVFSTDEREAGEHKISHGKLYRLGAYQKAAQTFLAALARIPSNRKELEM